MREACEYPHFTVTSPKFTASWWENQAWNPGPLTSEPTHDSHTFFSTHECTTTLIPTPTTHNIPTSQSSPKKKLEARVFGKALGSSLTPNLAYTYLS